MHKDEKKRRDLLGIPEDAHRVLLFGESSHWDPNWMLTSDEYYQKFVQKNMDLAIEALMEEPRRIYSVECIFFLRMYWDKNPEKQSQIRDLVNSRRLRLTSSGVTTADTLIPPTEAILRDFLIGQEWLRTRGMRQEPKLAYFTDSFGASPALPSILNAAGFEHTTITRVDGMHFPGSGFRKPAQHLDNPSSAKKLREIEETLDFLWRDRSGAQVLTHWNAFTYGQGDMLASRGLIRIYNLPTSFSDPSQYNVTRRIHQYERQLRPYAKTPYMFCPIGFDFVKPIPNLVSLLDRYNRSQYPQTGLWVLNAGLDDYLDLVDFHRASLPVLELDPNPYWTGFYSSRPTLKRRSYDLTADLILAEQLAFAHDHEIPVSEYLEEAWWSAVVANHHDFITGTSPNRIVIAEQIPWLERAAQRADSVIQQLGGETVSRPQSNSSQDPPRPTRKDGTLSINTKHYRLELDENHGGTILGIQPHHLQQARLKERSNDLVSYRDSGGLWRMGYEFRGGTWKINDRSSNHHEKLNLHPGNDLLEISSLSTLKGQSIRRQMWVQDDNRLLRFRITGRAALRHTYTVRFHLNLQVSQMVMNTPGGILLRPPKKVYEPTFWPLYQFAHLVDKSSGEGVAFFLQYPGAISYHPDGTLELVALRNARQEKAYRILPLPGNPAKGREEEEYIFDYALMFTARGDWQDNKLPAVAESFRVNLKRGSRRGHLWKKVSTFFEMNREDVSVLAAKPASRGDGWILRLLSYSAVGEELRLRSNQREILRACLCDARERDVQEIDVSDGVVEFTMSGTIATLRLYLSIPPR